MSKLISNKRRQLNNAVLPAIVNCIQGIEEILFGIGEEY